MKLKKLNINSYLHLKDLEFDFTYPENHEKAGQPLEKICFIGQSATGKTNLLKLLSETILYLLRVETVNNHSIWNQNDNYKNLLKEGFLELIFEDKNLILGKESIIYDNHNYDFNELNGGTINQLLFNKSNLNKILYFDSNYISNENLRYFNTKPLEITFEKNMMFSKLL